MEVESLLRQIAQDPGPLTPQERARTFRYFCSLEDFIGTLPQHFPKEASYWLERYAAKIIPLIGNPATPLETKLYLIDSVTELWRSPAVPVELVSDIFLVYLGICSKLNVQLDRDERLKVLISDDEQQIVLMMEDLLADLVADHGVETSLVEVSCIENGNGDLALATILTRPYSVLLIDEVKPGMQGREVIRRYRESARQPDYLTIIQFTAGGAKVEDSSIAGADAYLDKPFDIDVCKIIFGYGAKDRVHLNALRTNLREAFLGKSSPEKTHMRQLEDPAGRG